MAVSNNTRLHFKAKDLRGRTFRRLTVIALSATQKPSSNLRWDCLCECGKIISVVGNELARGNSTSCGCVRGNVQHGKAASRCYRIWSGMLQRCANSNVLCFARYGDRGIKVCERWKEFENFLADMGEPPTPEHSIDRINNDGNYEPSNCRWATAFQQTRNTRQNRFLTHNGETMCVTDWANRLGIQYKNLCKRLKKWPLERALGTPKQTI